MTIETMKHYKSIPETKQGTVFEVVLVSKNYFACEKKVDRVCLAIKKLLWSIGTVLEEVIPADATGQIHEKYEHCLKHTISIALDEVDKLIEQHCITSEKEINMLRGKVISLLDDVEQLFNQE